MSQLTTCPVCENEISYCECADHIPASGGTCPCAKCADLRHVDMLIAERKARLVPYTDVSTIHEYGLTQKLSNSVRVF